MPTIRQLIQTSPAKANELFAKLAETSGNAVKPRERYFAEAAYHAGVTNNLDGVIGAYRRLLESYPADVAALNGLGWAYGRRREYAAAEEVLRRAIAIRTR